MQKRSEIWKKIAAAGTGRLESIAEIGGVEYASISAPEIERALFADALSIGNCVSATLKFSLLTTDAIPTSAEVKIRQRLTDDVQYSEWLPAGTYYISKRSTDPVTGLMTFECYDAMLKANADYPSSEGFPKSMQDCVKEIAAKLGVPVDDRTWKYIVTGSEYTVPAAPEGYTMNDVLGHIGGVFGGNWIITPANRLRFVPLLSGADADAAPADERLDVLGVLGTITVGKSLTITGIKATIADQTVVVGSDEGFTVLLGANPYITKALQERLLASLSGMTYVPYTLTQAVYDPAAELGDYVCSKADLRSVLYAESATLNLAFRGTITAPYNAEIADEYPGSTVEKRLEEKIKDAQTQAAKDMAEIVTEFDADISNLQGQIDRHVMIWYYGGVPTESNQPAKDWQTVEDKELHLGDMYFDTATGYCYRWNVKNAVYAWERITDADVIKALADSANAQSTADQKRRVFYETPMPPYDKGDLWVQGGDGDILFCQTPRLTGIFVTSDWVLASKYTDDTVAQEALEGVSTVKSEVEKLDEKIALRVTQEEFNALGERMLKAESQIEVNTEGIESKVSRQEVQTEIEEYDINKRNFLLDTGDGITMSSRYSSDQYRYFSDAVSLLQGREICLSAKVKIENGVAYNTSPYVRFDLRVEYADGDHDSIYYNCYFENVGSDEKIPDQEITVIQTRKIADKVVINSNNAKFTTYAIGIDSGTITLTDIEVNVGNTPILWAPAPEDTMTEKKVESLIEQHADSIRLKADRISWESTYSSMSEDGRLVCTGAEINGTLHAQSGWNGIDVGEDGYLLCFSYWNWLRLEEGEIHGGTYPNGYDSGEDEHGVIDFTATIDSDKGPRIYGDAILLDTYNLGTPAGGSTFYRGWTGAFQCVIKIENISNNRIQWTYGGVVFQNGLAVGT